MGKYFSEKERYKLEGYLDAKISVKEIAVLLNKTKKTIYNEIERGKTEKLTYELEKKIIYLADVAERKYQENKKNKGVDLKISNDYDFVKFVEHWIGKEKYSPYAVLQKIKNEGLKFKTEICEKTLYNYICNNLFLNISSKNLPEKRERKKQTYKRTIALHNLKGKSIEERPTEIRKRKVYGHWELDTVIGTRGKACLLVFTERKTREEIIVKIPNKKNASVVNVLDRLEKRFGTKIFKATFKTITCDNGVEFLDFKSMEKCKRSNSKRTVIYYCHPFSSWERGSNENANRLIRRFIPKGSMIEKFSDNYIKYIEKWMNNYPRRILNGKSSYDLKSCA